MKFVPAGTDGVLFCIWDVRVKDYAAFVKETGRDWRKPSFDQTENDPAVNVSWNDARTFCSWLTDKDRAKSELSSNQEYRLPSDAEWSKAVGLDEEIRGTPSDKDRKIEGIYPWGKTFPAPSNAGNYSEEPFDYGNGAKGHRDGYEHTSPVGSFPANQYGLFDIGGNVYQWCEDMFDSSHDWRVLRGGSWSSSADQYLSSYREHGEPDEKHDDHGFRVVLQTLADLTKTQKSPSDITNSEPSQDSTTSRDHGALPQGVIIPGRPGFVHSPYAIYAPPVDVRGNPVGSKVMCPYTSKYFIVPKQDN